MNEDFSALLTDICETRGLKGKRMAEYLERTLHALLHGESVLLMYQATINALNDPECLDEWEEDQ